MKQAASGADNRVSASQPARAAASSAARASSRPWITTAGEKVLPAVMLDVQVFAREQSSRT